MNAVAVAVFGVFCASIFSAYTAWAILYSEKCGYRRGKQDGKPIRLSNGQLMGRK